MEISIVIPAYNEAESLPGLIRETADAVARLPVREILAVDDASDDNSQEVLKQLGASYPLLRVLRHTRRSGQSTGLWTGVRRARGDLIVTMDGDGQNDPADIPRLFAEYEKNAGVNPRTLVAGQRRKRHDNTVRRLSSRIANGVRAAVLQDGVKDTGCSLKLFPKNDFLDLPFFNHIHRFIPAMMKAHGAQIVLVDVGHRPRLRGVSKYGLWDRLWVGIADIVGVRWLTARFKPATDVVVFMSFLTPTPEHIWVAVGFIGQILFFMRFLLQWIASEKKGASTVPVSFWYFSIAGGAVLLAYAIWRQDPVFIAGQGLGVVIYARNLYFIHCGPKKQASPS